MGIIKQFIFSMNSNINKVDILDGYKELRSYRINGKALIFSLGFKYKFLQKKI